MPIQIEIRGMDIAVRGVGKLGAFDLHAALTHFGNTLRNQSVMHFQNEAGPAGRWAPLKESTLKRSPRRAGGKILSDTGKLKGSISASISGLQVEVGTNVNYGKFHQEGTKKMVARPFLGLTHHDEDQLRHVIDAFFASLIR